MMFFAKRTALVAKQGGASRPIHTETDAADGAEREEEKRLIGEDEEKEEEERGNEEEEEEEDEPSLVNRRPSHST